MRAQRPTSQYRERAILDLRLAHGARIVDNSDALKLSQRVAREFGTVILVNSVNPDRIEGQKTTTFADMLLLRYQ